MFPDDATAPPPAPPSRATGGRDLVAQFELADKVHAEAERQGVDPDLVAAVVRRESAWNPKATSKVGARGLMQLMPDTAKMLGVEDPTDPDQNIRGGVAYLKRMLDLNKDKPPAIQRRLALAAYNAGPAAVARYGGIPPFKETQQYVDAIAPQSDLVSQFEAMDAAPTPGTPQAEGVAGPPALGTAPGTPPAPPPDPRLQNPGMLETGASKLALGLHDAFDPFTPSGRRNLASGAGAIVAGVATGGTGVLPALAMAGGAAGGGMLAEGGEQLAGTKPYDPYEIPLAGAEQGAMELIGHGLVWPLRALGRRLVANTVSQNAVAHLTKAKTAAIDAAKVGLDAAEGALRATRDAVGSATARAKDAGAAMVGRARETATRTLEDASVKVKAGVAAAEAGMRDAATTPYTKLVEAGGPPRAQVGRQVQGVIEGPAKTALEQAGAAVGAAAKTGPPTSVVKIKAAAQRIIDQELQPPAEAFPRAAKAAEGDAAEDLLQNVANQKFSPQTLAKMSPEVRANYENAQLLQEGAKEAAKEKAKGPVMQLMSRIVNAEDEVPFEAVHLFKRELSDTIRGTADQAERSRLQALTAHMTGELRSALRETAHAPYESATATYRAMRPMFTKGHVAALKKAATDNPEELIDLIKPGEPTRLKMLREVLTTQAEKGGGPEGAAAGQAAWDSVREAWTHQHVIRGGIEGLEGRLNKLTPEFLQEMYGDASGSQVVQNLRTIAQGFAEATAQGPPSAAVAQARAAGAQTLLQTKRAGRTAVAGTEAAAKQQLDQATIAGQQAVGVAQGGVRTARKGLATARTPSQEATDFFASSVAPGKVTSAEEVITGAGRAALLGPTTRWGSIALLRLLKGPKSADLVRWAAYSPQRTQLLVHAFTSPIPGEGLAQILRGAGLADLVPSRTGASAGGPPQDPAAGPPGPP